MADTLRIKRRVSGAPGAPSGLANAELAYNEVDHTLYYGEGTGGAGGSATVVVPIGGSGLGSSALPLMDAASANAGVAVTLSRGDHVHPYPTTMRIDQLTAPNVDVPWNSKKITGLLDPINPQDAATKNYVDSASQGLDAKQSVRCATTANLAALSGLLTIDGVTVTGAERVLVKDQTAQAQNGIYFTSASAWTRTTDADAWLELVSAYVFVEQGAINADTGWVCTVDAPTGVLGTTPVTWTQFSGAGQVVAGAGLTKTGSQLDVVGTAGRISVAADSIDIDVAYIGQTSIATVGTIGTGVWNATLIAVAKGGSGAATFTAGYLKANGTNPFATVAQIPNADISGLGTMALQNANAVAITGGTIDGVTLDCGTF